MFRYFIRLSAVFLLSPLDLWAQPQLAEIVPFAIQRNAEVELTFRGTQLTGAHSLLIYGDDLELLELTSDSESQARARCRVQDSCALGNLGLRLACDGGISNLLVVTVTDLAVVAEVEPNTVEQPQAIPRACAITGTISYEDQDVFTFEVNAGQRLSAEMYGLRSGYEFYDPCLELRDPTGKVLAFADDSSLTRQDPGLSLEAPASGRYTLICRERTFRGGPRCHYVLQIGSFPRPQFSFPGGGKAGSPLSLLLGPSPFCSSVQVSLPEDGLGIWPWFYADNGGTAPTAIPLHVTPWENSLESEPNDAPQQANPVQLPTVICGVLGTPGDHDFFQFSATAGQVWIFRSVARHLLRSPIDTIVRVRDAKRVFLSGADDSYFGADGMVEFTAPNDGEYTLEVCEHLDRGGEPYVYRIECSPRQPMLHVELPQRQYNVPPTLPVCQGNRMAILLLARREYFDGEVQWELGDVPEGVQATLAPVPAGRDRIPLLVTASPEAPLAARLVPLVGRSQAGEQFVVSPLIQRTMLAIGDNNRDMWGHDARQLACAVVRKAPFHLNLITPQAPLVRWGEKPLRMEVEREEGFQEPIQVQMLYNPPGVSSPGNWTIPGDTLQAELPVTANGAAELGTWPLVLLAQTVFQGTRYEVSSDIVPLQIEDYPFDVTFASASVEQGQASHIKLTFHRRRPALGPSHVELLGLPPGVTSQTLDLAADQSELEFPIQAAADARLGRFPSIYCRITSPVGEESIVQTAGTGQLRVDAPLPQSKPSTVQPES